MDSVYKAEKIFKKKFWKSECGFKVIKGHDNSNSNKLLSIKILSNYFKWLLNTEFDIEPDWT